MTFAELTALVEERLPRNKRLRRNIPGGGRLRMDRQLPFLCVYRRPDVGDVGTSQLVTTEGSYLVVYDPINRHEEVRELCRSIACLMQEHYGVFVLVEIWSEEDQPDYHGPAGFGVWCSEQVAASAGKRLDAFRVGLERIQRRRQPAEVTVHQVVEVAPPGLPPFETQNWGIPGLSHVGLSARPIYRSQLSGVVYPLVLNGLRRRFSNALRRAIYDYTNQNSRQPTAHFQSLGPSHMVRATRLMDQKLVDISESFDFLLQVSPLNAEQAWQDFSESGFRTAPDWHYRPLPYHPSLLKRNLYELPIEHIEDATLAQMFDEKQNELDRQITALASIGTSRFLYDSIQIYGTPDASLVALSRDILNTIPATVDESEPAFVFTEEIAEAAREHIDYYHQKMPEFDARVDVSTGIAAGLLVSRDRLHVSVTARLRRARLMPLMHHEVGTHLLTYFNGKKQPLRQLYAGLAGYEELQEGLAVLAEYLAGGLTSSRMRTLAGRVIAARMMVDGAGFAETFDVLHREHQLSPFGAFSTTMRAFRGGGLTKDAIYLRGLRDLLAYLAQGHDIEPLYVGKIGLRHVPFIQQLRRREIVQPPAVLPRLWEQPGFQERLEKCRTLSVLELIEEPS